VKYKKINLQWVGFIPLILLLYIYVLQGQAYPGGALEGFKLVKWVSYVVIVMMVPIYFVSVALRMKTIDPGIIKYIIGLITLMCYSTYYYSLSIISLIESIVVYLRYPILFLMINNLLNSNKTIKLYIYSFIIISVLLCVEAIFNYLFLGLSHDDTFITLGPNGGHVVAGVVLLYSALLVGAHAIISGTTKYHLTFITLIILPMIIASTRGALVFMLFLLLILLFIYKSLLKSILIYVGSLLFNVTIIVVSYLVFLSNYRIDIYQVINPVYRINYIGGMVDYLISNGNLLFGSGVRSMASGSVGGSAGIIYSTFSESYQHLLMGGTNQYVKALSEIGIIGFSLYWLMLAKILALNVHVWKHIRKSKHYSNFDKSVSLGFFAIWIHYSSIGLFYNDFWRFDISSLTFWVFAVYIYKLNVSIYSNNYISNSMRKNL
jgi:hypothetical protein